MSQSVPAVSIPTVTLENMEAEMIQKREMTISFIKHFASTVAIADWRESQMPDLILAYSSYEQVIEYLDKKFTDEHSHSEGGILFAEQELLLLTQVLQMIESATSRLSAIHNVSLEVH